MPLISAIDDDEDGPSRHAPAGYQIVMQHFGGTREAAIKRTARVLRIKIADLVAEPGHFCYGDTGEDPPVFRPYGWMVFEREG